MRACARDQNPVVPQGTSIISSGIFAGWNARESPPPGWGGRKLQGWWIAWTWGHIERNANTSQGCFAENDEKPDRLITPAFSLININGHTSSVPIASG